MKRRSKQHGTPIYGDRYTDPHGVTLTWSPTCGRYLPLPEEAEELAKPPEPPKVIGVETVYTGHEARFGGHGARVVITGVFCRGRCPGIAPEDGEAGHVFVTDDLRLAQLGGVQAGDGVEVHFWLDAEGHWGFVAHEIENANDLAVFGSLKRPKSRKGK